MTHTEFMINKIGNLIPEEPLEMPTKEQADQWLENHAGRHKKGFWMPITKDSISIPPDMQPKEMLEVMRECGLDARRIQIEMLVEARQ